jgi:hypothetical protein
MSGYLYRGSPRLAAVNEAIMADRAAGTGGWRNRPEAGHGTSGRAQRHRRAGEKPCAECLAAERLARVMATERRSR